jgi:hypothetical protein
LRRLLLRKSKRISFLLRVRRAQSICFLVRFSLEAVIPARLIAGCAGLSGKLVSPGLSYGASVRYFSPLPPDQIVGLFAEFAASKGVEP